MGLPRALAASNVHIYIGTAGLGREAILALARHGPKHIFFTGRNASRASTVIAAVNAAASSVTITFIQCDQTSLTSVESGFKQFLATDQSLDILICNAGVMGTDAGLTSDGYENQFGVNHMAHALMVKMLMPALQRANSQSGEARIVFVSSSAFRWTPSGGICFSELKTTQDYFFAGRWMRYGQSKLANLVYAAELARRYPTITSVSVHPGTIWTELISSLSAFNRAFIYIATLGKQIKHDQGAYNICWAATTPKKNVRSGAFYEPVAVLGSLTKDSENKELGEHLWTWTQDELKSHGA